MPFFVIFRMLHEAHHEYSHAMNVFVVGYAGQPNASLTLHNVCLIMSVQTEMMENFIMVGWPWLFWTVVIHHYGNQNLYVPIAFSDCTYTYFDLSTRAILAPPLSITAFTTLIGHSGEFAVEPLLPPRGSWSCITGYKYHMSFAMFHPLIIPFLVPGMSKYMLTPGDHQVHHSHRRFNFGWVSRSYSLVLFCS